MIFIKNVVRAGKETKLIEDLLCTHEGLDSIPSTTNTGYGGMCYNPSTWGGRKI